MCVQAGKLVKKAAASVWKGTGEKFSVVGEKHVEVILAGKGQDQKEAIYEITDFMYHGMV